MHAVAYVQYRYIAMQIPAVYFFSMPLPWKIIHITWQICHVLEIQRSHPVFYLLNLRIVEKIKKYIYIVFPRSLKLFWLSSTVWLSWQPLCAPGPNWPLEHTYLHAYKMCIVLQNILITFVFNRFFLLLNYDISMTRICLVVNCTYWSNAT